MHGRIRIAGLIAVALAAAGLFGCSSEEPETPAACLGGSDAYLAALEVAPGQVRLDGSTPISDCIVEGQDGGQLAQVGRPIIEAATKLNVEARKNPSGPQAVQLGYLVGAVQKGAGETGGIHADLVRRLDTAARFSRGGLLPAEFERAFGTGYAAAQDHG